MPVAYVRDGAPGWPRPPVRLRMVLLLGAFVAAVFWAYPRAGAAWQVYGHATELADYGRCMVGPTGPALIRDNPSAYRTLLRQRLITSPADVRPFARCGRLAEALAGPEVLRIHQQSAGSFVEYGNRQLAPSASLDELGVSMRALSEQGEQAWPFIRGGVTRLVKPSSAGPEALHPVPFAAPGLGEGLPALDARYRVVHRKGGTYRLALGSGANLSVYESKDGGLRWRHAPVGRFPSRLAGHCGSAVHGASFRFQLSADGKRTQVLVQSKHSTSRRFEVASAGADVFAAACDSQAAVLAMRRPSSSDVELFVCYAARGCGLLPLPSFGKGGPAPQYPLDIARVGKTTVLAVAQGGIVRVASTHDDGETWTPFSVAFDRDSVAHMGRHVPFRLLALDGDLLLYSGDSQGRTYDVLLSEDGGASWRSPE